MPSFSDSLLACVSGEVRSRGHLGQVYCRGESMTAYFRPYRRSRFEHRARDIFRLLLFGGISSYASRSSFVAHPGPTPRRTQLNALSFRALSYSGSVATLLFLQLPSTAFMDPRPGLSNGSCGSSVELNLVFQSVSSRFRETPSSRTP